MSSLPNHIKAVIFDLDDTLIDWSKKELDGTEVGQRHMINVYQYLCQHGHAVPPLEAFFQSFNEALVHSWTEAKKTWAGVAFEDVLRQAFQQMNLDLNRIDINEVMKAYDWGPVPGVTPYEDTLPVLKNLRQHGFKLGLITNSMQPMWMRDIELRAYGILDYLDARVTSGDTGFMKPHPFIYWRVLEMLSVEPNEAVFVGDRPANDIAGANEAGLVSVLMNPPHLDYELNRVHPDFTITRLRDLLPVLATLTSES